MPRGIPNAKPARPYESQLSSALREADGDSSRLIDEPTESQRPDQAETVAIQEAAQPVELTPDQIEIKNLQNQLALERGKKDPEPELETAESADGSTILIHFLEDGLTSNGKLWMRGQEVEYVPGSQAYKDTCDRNGKSWLDLRSDEFAQVERWGKVMFRVGPWPGKTYLDAVKVGFQALKPLSEGGHAPAPPSEAELQAAQDAETKRRRAAPRLPAS